MRRRATGKVLDPFADPAGIVNKPNGMVFKQVREYMSIAAVPRGEALADGFEELYIEHCRLIYRTAYAITGNRQDAEDVLQSVFLKLLQGQASSELKPNARAYLHRASVNSSLNILRSRKRQKEIDGVEALEIPDRSGAENGLDAEEELHRRLLDAIEQLKPKAAEILLLHYKHNYSDAEIAKMLGKSRGSIAVTLYRIRGRLKKLLRAVESKPGARS